MNILGLNISDEFVLPFIFTIIIILVKFILSIFLASKIVKIKKKKSPVATSFLSGMLFLMICLLISRILYMIFDYVLTNFDMNLYGYFPNIWYWKTASLISAVGIGVLLLIIDRRVLQNKFKGIFSIIIFIASVVQFFYPVRDPNIYGVAAATQDFGIITMIGTIAGLCAFVIPILFFWIGAKTPGLRKTSFAVAIGTIIYLVGSAFVSANFIGLLGLSSDVMYALSTIMKTIGLVMITYGATHFAT